MLREYIPCYNVRVSKHRHIPVLLDKVVAALRPRPGKVIVDCTVGLGGHAVELLRRVGKKGRVIGLDLDPANVEAVRALIPEVRHANFAALQTVLGELGIERVDGLLADLGVASPHIDEPSRGFSYRRLGPLDMRMDPTRGEPASKLLDRMSEEAIATALLELGDEEEAPEIARLIVERRPVRTTQELASIVCEARDFTLSRAAGAKLHPAARTFQALRILVNRELANLDRLLAILPDVLAPGGVAAIITFHSGEDRRVKQAFRNDAYVKTGGPITASEEEIAANARSKSAKLRWAQVR